MSERRLTLDELLALLRDAQRNIRYDHDAAKDLGPTPDLDCVVDEPEPAPRVFNHVYAIFPKKEPGK